MEGCVFCKIYGNREEVAYENGYFYARFDRFPVSPGHAEIIPIRHVVSVLDLTEDEWKQLKTSIRDTIKIIESTDLNGLYKKFLQGPLNTNSKKFCSKMLEHMSLGKRPGGYNIGVNEGEAAGRTVDHLHIHVIPRYFGDVEDYAGGIRNIIPGMGNYRK